MNRYTALILSLLSTCACLALILVVYRDYAQCGTDNSLDTALHRASSSGAIGSVQLLIYLGGANVNDTRSKFGRTPLHFAATGDICKILIKAGADVHVKEGMEGQTPLHIAAYKGHADSCEVLIKAGADVHAKDLQN